MNIICSVCNQERPYNFFYSKGKGKFGTRKDCKLCAQARERKHYHSDPEKQRKKNKLKYQNHKDRYRKYREKNKDKHRAYIIKKEYGISYDEYKSILLKQNFSCCICLKKIDIPHIDHNHATGKVRGVLCRTCNLGIGYFFDNPNILEKATQYIKKNSKILLTGAYGLLGSELRKQDIDFVFYKKTDFDFTDINHCKKYLKGINLIVHAGAFTNLIKAEEDKKLCYETNVFGTRNLASLGIPIIYISTEYIFEGDRGSYAETDYPNPQNFYAYTKLLGEYESRKSPRSVVIRCLFKPRPFKHDVVCSDSITSGDYVDRIAPEIALAIKNFNNLPKTIHIGTGRKSLESLARETKPGISTCSVDDIKLVKLPKDTSLDCSLWNKLKESF